MNADHKGVSLSSGQAASGVTIPNLFDPALCLDCGKVRELKNGFCIVCARAKRDAENNLGNWKDSRFGRII